MSQVTWQMHYDRRVSSEFLNRFRPGQPLHMLVDVSKHAPFPLDLQLRRSPKTGDEHASLYVGLTDVLTVDVGPADQVRLKAHKTWSEPSVEHPQGFGFRSEWKKQGVANDQWDEVEDYLERVLPVATEKHAKQEGSVQAAVSKFAENNIVMLDREATMHFRDAQTRQQIMTEVVTLVVRALQGLSGVSGQAKTSFGGECDLLGLDKSGRLLTIEVKPRSVGTIRWAAAQATVYAKLFERWLTSSDLPATPSDVLRGEWQQRAELKLSSKVDARVSQAPVVVPFVVVHRRTRSELLDEFWLVQRRLVEAGVGFPGLELWESSITGRLKRLNP